MIVHESSPVTLIGGGDLFDGCINQALSVAPRLIAADGGANKALSMGYRPSAVIGDFDSVSDTTLASLPPESLHRIAEQDSTDFEKCLREVSAPFFVGVGFTGARIDHQLAVFNALVRFPTKRCILLGQEDVVFLCPPSLQLNLPPGTPVSLFPLGAVEGVSDGLEWPINGLLCAPDGQISTSNHATGPLDISVTAPKMLMILPRAYFEDAVAALMARPSGW